MKKQLSMPKGLFILIDNVGEDSAREFLIISQKLLKQEHQELLHCLHENSWKKAAKIAHRLKATANLYASTTLLSCYEKILCQQQVIKNKSDFVRRLTEELQQVEKNIKIFIEGNDT